MPDGNHVPGDYEPETEPPEWTLPPPLSVEQVQDLLNAAHAEERVWHPTDGAPDIEGVFFSQRPVNQTWTPEEVNVPVAHVSSVAPPTGWMWNSVLPTVLEIIPEQRPIQSSHAYNTLLVDLRHWLIDNGFNAGYYHNLDVSDPHCGAYIAPSAFTISWGTERQLGDSDARSCRSCLSAVPIGYTHCMSCQSRQLACIDCGLRVFHVRDVIGENLCSLCITDCETCGAVCSIGTGFCRNHQPSYCAWCDAFIEGEPLRTQHDEALCEPCYDRICPNCGESSRNRQVIRNEYGEVFCQRCYDGPPVEPGDFSNSRLVRGWTEQEDDDTEPVDLAIPPIPGRENIRRSGVEIEGAGSGDALAYALHAAGHTQYRRLQGWRTQERNGFVGDQYVVESDSSVDWELVSPVIHLNDAESIQKLNAVVDILRDQIKQKRVALDTRCGLHIHIEAMPASATGAFNLAILWGYLEDLMFRLGSANWPTGHRSLVEGSEYARPIPKGYSTVREFGRIIGDNPDRYNALSFDNFFSRLFNGCMCGAVRYDDWSTCTCNLGKCTFEFRVFNTTANKVKLHAYLALCQALVAKATSLPEALSTTALEPLDFVPSTLETMAETRQKSLVTSWKPRLKYIFQELPLTEKEKGSLLYCVKNSDLNTVGADFINKLIVPETTIQEVTA